MGKIPIDETNHMANNSLTDTIKTATKENKSACYISPDQLLTAIRQHNMGRIERTYDTSRDLTAFKAVGFMVANDFIDCLQSYYEAGATSLALWDLSEAELSGLTSDEISNLAQYGSQLASTRTEGKTAIVFNSPFEYGLGRIFQTFVEMNTIPVEVKLFRSLNEATEWLGGLTIRQFTTEPN